MFSSNTSQIAATSSLAEAIDFDGTNDFLSRSTDLTGSADSKTFTFSCWLWHDDWSNSLQIYVQTNTSGLTTPFVIFSISSGTFNVAAYNSAGTEVLNASVASVANAARTFTHVLVSVDLASTSNRAIYINDVARSVTWTTYTNSAIDFTQLYRGIGARPDNTAKNRTRLSNVFLDYTYRDLSIIANRRLFVTADLKPAISQNSVVKYIQNNFAFPNSINNAKFFNNGSTIVYSGSATDTAYSYDLSTPYDLKTAGGPASWQISSVGAWSGPCFNSDGTKAYFANKNNDTIYSHTNSTAWRITGSTNVSATLGTAGSTGDMMLAHDDTQLYRLADSASGGTIQQFSFGTPGDITTLTFVGQINMNSLVSSQNIRSIYVDTLRGFVYTVDVGNFIREFQFGTPKVISSLTSTGKNYFTGTFNYHVAVSPNYLLLGDNANAYIYNITDYDITTAYYGQSSGSPQAPILYLPLTDPTAPGLNQGSGGNFTLTGTVARSGRGPNQYNAPYSDLDGTADYLSRTTAPTGIADGKTFTLAFTASIDSVAAGARILDIGSTTLSRFSANMGNSGELQIVARDSSGTLCFSVSLPVNTLVINRNYNIILSVDLSNTSNRFLYLNGVLQTPTWGTYTNTDIDFLPTGTPSCTVGRATTSGSFLDGRLGALWFNTSYIDLSVAANLAKFVTGTGIDAKPVDLGANGELPTGTSPIIYLPMYGNNAGKNYGTGGDFTVNSGPYTGARGPNEFWGNLATFNGTNSYLSKAGAISGLGNSKTFSLSLFFNKTLGTTDYLISWPTTGGNHTLFFNTATSMNQAWKNTLGNTALGGWNPTIPDATNVHLLICVDMDDVNKCKIYINGTVHAGTPGTFVTGTTLDFASINNPVIGVYDSASLSTVFNGKLSEFYFTNQYIDFTQEANRLKFRDAFGNPVDLTQQIEDAAIPNPAIYMRFPPTSFGTNSGTGGNFTVNGTISDGGQL